MKSILLFACLILSLAAGAQVMPLKDGKVVYEEIEELTYLFTPIF